LSSNLPTTRGARIIPRASCKLFLDLVLDDLALFLDDEDLFEPFGERRRPLRLQRPDIAT